MTDPDQDDDLDVDLEALAAAYAEQVASTSRHPITATTTDRAREVLSAAFTAAVEGLGAGTPPEVEVSSEEDEGPDAVGTSTTRTAATDTGRVVLHETSTRDLAGTEVRTTIALTGSTTEGHRFWLGATSHAGGPVDHVELLGELPPYVAPLLGQVLTSLRGA